jgi:hypothetical protein
MASGQAEGAEVMRTMWTGAAGGLGIACMVVLAGCGDSRGLAATGAGKDASYAWRAQPAMISNVGVYREHEFVYQDYIYDDHGANTDGKDRFDAPLGTPGPDPSDPVNPRFSPAPLVNFAGDFTYAAASGHMANVADLIEFRAAADAGNVYFRFRLGDMTAPDSAVVGVCVDEDDSLITGLAAWPLEAKLNEQLGCDHFYTVYGTGAKVTDAAGTRDLVELGGAVAADVDEAVIDVRIPRSVADPGNGRWRIFAGAGLWDAAAGTWDAPAPVAAAAGAPIATGGSPLVPNIWDLLSNNHEPNSTWDEEKQANDLTAHTILDDYLDVDFGAIASNRNDPDPELTGVVLRIYHAQHPTELRGIDAEANRVYLGPWQPYVAVIPHSYYEHPEKLYPFDQCLHPLGTNHLVEVFYAEAFARRDYDPVLTGVTPATGYLGFSQIEALVDRLDGVYACVLGRGEGVGYQGGDGLVDALEVRDDMLKHYRTDPERHTVHGVSLGAIGSWYVSRLYPDRYAAAMPYIFTADVTGGVYAADGSAPTLANLYNLPMFFSIGTLDQFGQGTQGDLVADKMEELGNEFLYLHFLARQHEGRIENDFLPFALKLAYTRTRVKDPARVVYVLDPENANFSPKIPFDGSVYWVSGMAPRDEAVVASIDVTSLGRADELPRHQVVIDGEYANPDELYTARMRGLFRMTEEEFTTLWHPEEWQPKWTAVSLTVTPTELTPPAVSNGFTLKAVNLKSVTLDAARMKLSGAVRYTVETDGPMEVRLSGGRSVSLPAAGSYEGSL